MITIIVRCVDDAKVEHSAIFFVIIVKFYFTSIKYVEQCVIVSNNKFIEIGSLLMMSFVNQLINHHINQFNLHIHVARDCRLIHRAGSVCSVNLHELFTGERTRQC